MKPVTFMAKACSYAQEHIHDHVTSGDGPRIRENRLECVSYQAACVLAQNSVEGWDNGVSWDIILDQLVAFPDKSEEAWVDLLNEVANKYGGWIEEEQDETSPSTKRDRDASHTGNKYLRPVHDVFTSKLFVVDVYSVLEAFSIMCPARQHAAKKLLCTGLRGKGDAVQDLKECRDAIDRALEMEIDRVNEEKNDED